MMDVGSEAPKWIDRAEFTPTFKDYQTIQIEGERKKVTDVFKSGGNILDHSALKALKKVAYY